MNDPNPFVANDAIIRLHIEGLRVQKRADNTLRARRETLVNVGKFLAARSTPETLLHAQPDSILTWQRGLSRLAAGTIANYTCHLQMFYRWCIRPMRLIVESPAEELALPRLPRRKPRPIPEDEMDVALACCRTEPLRTWLHLMGFAGLRCCEIAWLQRNGVYLNEKHKRIHVVGKGQHERIVYISDDLAVMLLPYLRRQGYLFVHENGAPYLPRMVSETTNNFLRELGLPYTAHQLRHRYGTRALQITKNLRAVQVQMGHASPETTQFYTDVDPEEYVAIATAMGADQRKADRGKPAT